MCLKIRSLISSLANVREAGILKNLPVMQNTWVGNEIPFENVLNKQNSQRHLIKYTSLSRHKFTKQEKN